MWTIYREGAACWVGFNEHRAHRGPSPVSIARDIFEVNRSGVRPTLFQMTRGGHGLPYLFTAGSERTQFLMEVV